MRNFTDNDNNINKLRIRKGPMGSTDEAGNYGAFKIKIDQKTTLFIIAADGDITGWEHVSVHVSRVNVKGKVIKRTPTWDEMCLVKDIFWNFEDVVIQFHPPRSEYVNMHKHCLHLWKPSGENLPTPPKALIGI